MKKVAVKAKPAKRIVIWDPTEDPSDRGDQNFFREFAKKAAEQGATHVCVSRLPLSRWQCVDSRDPHPDWASWPVWSMVQPSLFKIALPPELAEWIPQAEAKRNMDLIRARCAILRKLGLRATFHGNDPVWLPEGVYRAHPEWRGAHAELLRITRLPYFSPCIDHPEVLGLFRRAMAELCREAPELDLFSVFSNDSAGGVCWSGSYPGNNGPEFCRQRTMTERITGFLNALQDGARDAGHDIDVQLACFLNRDVQLSALRPRQYLNGRDREGKVWASGLGGNSWFGNHLFPVLGIPKVMTFAEELEAAQRAPTPRLMVNFGPKVDSLLTEIYAQMRKQSTCGPASRWAMLREVAAVRVGPEHAEALLEAWNRIEKAVENVRHCRGLGYISIHLVGAGMMRWVIMPLLPDLARLKPEEKAYYLKGRVVKNEIEADSYHALLGAPGITGPAAVWMAQNSLNEAIMLAKQAAADMEKLAVVAVTAQAKAELTALMFRLKALACVSTTCRNFIQYEDTLAQRGRVDEEVTWRDQTGTYLINRGSMELRNIARSEVDNVYELARLVETAPEPVMAMGDTPEEEDAFVFSSELPAQLRRKAQLMLDHWAEYEEFYPPVPVIGARQPTVNGDCRPGSDGDNCCAGHSSG